MKHKELLCTGTIAALLVIGLAADGACTAIASSWGQDPDDWNATRAIAFCVGEGGSDVQDNGSVSSNGEYSLSTANVNCVSCGAYALAYADNGVAIVSAREWVDWGFAGAGKDRAIDTGFTPIDTTTLEVYDVGGNLVRFTFDGKIKAYQPVTTELKVRLFQRGDTSDVFWTGTVRLRVAGGSSKAISPLQLMNFVAADFDSSSSADTVIYTFSVDDTVGTYVGSFDSVGCTLIGDTEIRKVPVPSLTHAGLLALLALLIAAGIWIYYRKRHVTAVITSGP